MSSYAVWRRSSATSSDALSAVAALLPDLWRRAHEADHWCRRARTPREVWSAALDPGVLAPDGAIPTARLAWAAAGPEVQVEDLVKRRRGLLGDAAAVLPSSPPEAGGICWYAPEQDLFDGAAEVASDLLFNAHNVPGWDTWLTLRHLSRALAIQIGAHPSGAGSAADLWILLAWIPGHLLAHAAEGIGVNPEQCIGWLYDPRRA